jgi:cyclopropane-fatty-acyl-phospholipid synthase
MLRTLYERSGGAPVALETWDGFRVSESDNPVAVMRIVDRGALFRLLRPSDIGFGEMYTAGRIRVEGDFVDFLKAVHGFELLPLNKCPSLWWLRRLLSYRPPNTPRRARNNIHHHYDLGNEFYRLWLDSRMQYTCAYFPRAGMSLEEAQLAKLDHICRKLQLKPGVRVVEAGCGWGSLALHMAERYGATVKAYNISRQQVAYARDAAQRARLADRVEYIEDDYRNIEGKFDVFVSVGMLEHVGPSHYRALGAVVDRCLTANGRALIHSIGRNRPRPMSAWIDKRIFPGGHPPALSEMAGILEPCAFSILDVENLRLHYAKTLERWLERYETQTNTVRSMFDDRFVRAWRLYLAGSIATFHCGELQLFQVLFARGGDNSVPMSRAYMYQDDQ